MIKLMKLKRKYASLLITLLTVLQVIPAYAGWNMGAGNRWQYQSESENPNYIMNAWQYIDGAWYRFDENGYMVTGWYQDTEQKWFFLEAATGKAMFGWQWIDGRCYYFQPEPTNREIPFGAMLTNTITPDGFHVNADGAWIDDTGKVVEVPGKGILTVQHTMAISGGKRGGNGGGGGSSGGSGGGSGNSGSSGNTDSGKDDTGDTGAGDEIMDEEIPVEEIPDEDIPDEDDTGEVSTPSDASPSDAEMIHWQVHFVDKDTHQIQIASGRQGKIKDGETLTINYRTKVIDSQKRIWESLEAPPLTLTAYGPGNQIYYVEFEQIGTVAEDEDPFAKEKEQLTDWIAEAKLHETLLTGEETGFIPDSRFIVSDQGENDIRLITAAGLINDTEEYVVYVIGKNMVPTGTMLKDVYREEIEYSNLTEDTIVIEEDAYTVARISMIRSFNEENCSHEWSSMIQREAMCLSKGQMTYTCGKCGLDEVVVLAALGHIDENGDSICDRCNTRAFKQAIGSRISTSISINGAQTRSLNFVCVDADYQGGMLYVAEEAIPVSDFSGYGQMNYLQSNPGRYFSDGWQNAFSISGAPLMAMEVDGGTGYAAMLSSDEAKNYGLTEYLTRTLSGSGLAAIQGDGTVMEADPDSGTYGIRPVILLTKPDAGKPDPVHWNMGDVQAREIDGETYLFRCVDENYSDKTATHRQAALFLCDSVIAADWGSEYKFEKQLDGSHEYVFHPGPIVNYGTTNDYKYSNPREWLKKWDKNFFNTEDINIGVSYAYTGSTGENQYSQLQESELTANYIGNQRMADKLFILSVDEALKYKDWLWKFDGADEDNPDTQYGAFCKGYWLRSPMGTTGEHNTKMTYIVDLVNGNIHPAEIKPDGGTDDEINVTGTTGVRPAFTMPQA